MEPVSSPTSSPVGIAGLTGPFNSSLNAINGEKDNKPLKAILQMLNALFKAKRLRFERWSRNVGVKQGQLSADTHHGLPNNARTEWAVAEPPTFIVEIYGSASPHEGRKRSLTTRRPTPSTRIAPKVWSAVRLGAS